ncbi:MAG: hypothetical protein IPF57_01130 [Gammaproteobacteria bacterium]|jgi:hypothetical protein|nr:hypothetical protein [Gammaproteobacteria bacterium]MBK8990425.1 hypothetical protein [Gammaproteobacteria bacterium]MBP6479416.1 hypothetical protein [Pseudomonadales bacterium]MBP7908719.1 hypothetical protein [Pseudomonadales bacterium]
MLTEARRQELSDLLRPVSPPRVLENVYTDDQRERLLDVVRQQGPWKLIIAQHFASAEELIATGSGGVPEGVTPTLDMFLTPTFRGFYANYSALLYPQIHDCFYNATFLELAKSYWGAKYAKPQMMLFNVNGPCGNTDPGHLDSPSFRGIRYENSPTWLCSVMGKSGLFKDYLIKSAQVITWFSHDPSSGFTYWPDGPLKAPQRLMPPVYNRGVVVQNEMLMHRGEANGAPEQQRPAGLDFTTTFSGDCADRDHWLLKTGDRVIARHHTNELRFLVHWTAEVFEDYDELKKNMEGTHNLTHEQAIDTLIKDVRSRGIRIETPSDPLHDPQFIRALNSAYDIGAPASYPEGAPVTPIYTQAA